MTSLGETISGGVSRAGEVLVDGLSSVAIGDLVFRSARDIEQLRRMSPHSRAF